MTHFANLLRLPMTVSLFKCGFRAEEDMSENPTREVSENQSKTPRRLLITAHLVENIFVEMPSGNFPCCAGNRLRVIKRLRVVLHA